MPPTGFVEEIVINYLTVAGRFAPQVGDGSRVSTTSTVVEPGGSEPLPATSQVWITRRAGAFGG
jgi:hypothetical protein